MPQHVPPLVPLAAPDQAGLPGPLPRLRPQRPLTEPEAWTLAEALRKHEPWLEWAGKREAKSFTVDPVALHIHERVSAQAILKAATREDINRSLFAGPEQEHNEAVPFQRHDVDSSNRLILSDSNKAQHAAVARALTDYGRECCGRSSTSTNSFWP